MKRARFVTYKAKDGYRWRLRAANGKIIAESGEAYVRRDGALAGVRRVKIACYDMVAHG